MLNTNGLAIKKNANNNSFNSGNPIKQGANTFFPIQLLSSLPLAYCNIWFCLYDFFNLHRFFFSSCREEVIISWLTSSFKRLPLPKTRIILIVRQFSIKENQFWEYRKKCMHSMIISRVYFFTRSVCLYVSWPPHFSFRNVSKS